MKWVVLMENALGAALSWTWLIFCIGLGLFATFFPERLLRLGQRDYPTIGSDSVVVRIGGAAVAIMTLGIVAQRLADLR